MNSFYTRYLPWVYFVATVLWCVFIVFLGMYRRWQGWFVSALLFCLFAVTVNYLHQLCPRVEEQMNKSNLLSVGLIILVPLFALLERNFSGNRSEFGAVLIMALLCSLLSLMDIWVCYDMLYLVRHIKSILQMYSLFLLVYALLLSYHSCSGLFSVATLG